MDQPIGYVEIRNKGLDVEQGCSIDHVHPFDHENSILDGNRDAYCVWSPGRPGGKYAVGFLVQKRLHRKIEPFRQVEKI